MRAAAGVSVSVSGRLPIEKRERVENGAAPREDIDANSPDSNLIGLKGLSTFSRSHHPTLEVTIKRTDTDQSASQRETAIRLVCSAMIRLYLEEQGRPP